jgi:hypothetical protein
MADAYYALKARLNPEGRHDLRTVRALGAYRTFAAACDGAVRACRAAMQDEDARQYRYLVRQRASVPHSTFARIAAGKRRRELARATNAR